MNEPPDMNVAALRIVLPVVVLALGVLVWDLVVRLNDIAALHPAGAGLVLRRSSPTGRSCGVAARDAEDHVRRACCWRCRRRRARRCCSISRG